MEDLPDDVLLEVMSYLGVPDLLACRLVCKRIGELALHPYMWRRRSISIAHRPTSGSVLRFAPCLRSFDISLPCSPRQLQLYTATRCAAAAIRLTIDRHRHARGQGDAAALIIRNQEALGRLEVLKVKFYPDRDDADAAADAFTLLWEVACISGLHTLEVDIDMSDVDAVSPTPKPGRSPPRSTLKSFNFTITQESVAFCDFVLATHAPTLETIDFESNPDDFTPSLPLATSMASLLAGMPNLRSLEDCPLIPGMEVLAACESLRDVSLCVGSGGRRLVRGAAEFLRRAKQLRDVTLKYNADIGDVGVELVLALGSSGPSFVESLEIQFSDLYLGVAMPQVQSVSRALPRMSALRDLTLPMSSREVLLAITPEANPALRTLKLYQGELDGPGCAHRYLHWDSVVTVLSKNPLLELSVYASYRCSRLSTCDWCELECHLEVWPSRWVKEAEASDWPDPHDILIPRLD